MPLSSSSGCATTISTLARVCSLCRDCQTPAAPRSMLSARASGDAGGVRNPAADCAEADCAGACPPAGFDASETKRIAAQIAERIHTENFRVEAAALGRTGLEVFGIRLLRVLVAQAGHRVVAAELSNSERV